MSQDRTKTPTRIHPTPNAFADALRRMKRDDELVTKPVRRTLGAMMPGFERQPVLRFAPAVELSEVDAVRAEVRRLTGYTDSARFQSAPRETQATALDNLRHAEDRLAKLTANDTPCIFCDQWLCPGNCQGFAPVPSGITRKAVA
ncbi:hypothetical protein [Streptomyces sp. NPDC046371]|uniref:hypothetical protein n=1 Tax=Streptomyces sp. NPDC046371 TaxID=3154916 RepID=UPI0033DC2190